MSSLHQAQAPVADGKRRRRLWSEAEKRRIVAETLLPGASVSVVARRHDLNANMLFTWRRELGAGGSVAAEAATAFVPAVIGAGPVAATSPSPWVGRMEITLSGCPRVIVGADVDAAALARVIKVLARR